MSFFYDLNKKLDSIRATPEVTHQQLNERDMKKTGKLEEEGFPRIQAAIQKYTQPGVNKLAKLGREGASKAKMAATRKKFNQYDNEEVKEESGEWSKIPVGVIDGPGGYDGAQQRIKDYESGNINRDGKTSPPVVDRSRPADKPTVYDYRGQPEEYSSPPEWKGGYRPPVVDRSRPVKSVDEDMYNQGGVYKDLEIEPKRPQDAERKMTRGTRPAPKGEFMGTIKGGVWTADPPKPGEKGVPVPKNHERVPESGKKLNFADKIANAKKEVDEMLGDVAAEAMRSALSPKQKKMAALGGDPKRIDGPDLAALRKGADMGEDNAFDYKTPRSMNKGEKKTSSTGGEIYQKDNKTVVHTAGRHYGGGDEPNPNKEKRTKAGRPDGTGKKIGAKGPSGKSKLMTKEGDQDITDQGEYDQEGDMAKDDIKTIMRHAQALSKVLGDNDNLPEWVQSKLAKIEGMMISIDEYMQNQEDEEEPIAEKAVSKKQQRFMGMVHSAQKGEKPASKAVGKVANTMKPKDTADFAKTKHKGLPEKKKKEVDETSEEGRITTTRTGPGKTLTTSSTGRVNATIGNGKMSVKPGKSDKPIDADTDTASNKDTSSSKSNSMVGKGIYDSMNRELELMIAESMSINMSDSTEGGKSLTITATDEDALKLGMLLKNAGLGGGDAHGGDMHSHGEEVCDTCGMQDCGCGDVQEAVDDNAPDYPTNTEQAANNFGYAGGLNKPKTDVAGDGQSTVPVTAVHTQAEDALRRMMEMAGLAEAAKPDFLDINKNGDKEESMKDAAADVNEEDTVEESMHRMREAAGIKIKNNLGPISPDIARMSKDEVNAALRSGMNSKVDLGPTSPDIARMSKDEVDAALRSGMSPDISNMDPDSVNAEFGKDSIQRMKEMAGIREAKKAVDEEKTEEGNLFTKGLEDNDVKIGDKIPGTNAIKTKDIGESIFALTNQWKAYKG